MSKDYKDFLEKHQKQIQWTLFGIFMFIGVLARIWQFGIVPGDINQDEALAGYEAYSLLHYGKDSSGYTFPVYLTAWGSGMNVLNSLLMIPFIAIFGLKTWVIRTPQLIVACLSLWVLYLIIKEIIDEKAALVSLFLAAITPWHIMLARWGLESNLAPGFLLFGLYFFIRGLKQAKFFLLSALMYGLSLYCYATIWPFVPVILLLQLVYCLIYKKIKFQKETILSVVLLFVMALPLLLFLLINNGYMNEIRLPFMSIPKLVYMRDSEISFSNISENWKNLWGIITSQTDGLPWNSTERFGLFYPISLPFFFLGLFYYLKKVVMGFKNKEFSLDIFVIIQLLAGIFLGLLISVNINRVNCLWLPMLIMIATGIWYLCKLINFKLLIIPLVIYSVLFIQFEQYYFTDYKTEIYGYFCGGLEDAMEEATSHEGTIYVTSSANYARVMFYSKQDVEEYISTVQYTNYPSPFLDVSSFGRFQFYFDLNALDPAGIYLVDSSVDPAYFTNAGYTTKSFGYYTVAWMQ